MSVRRRPYPEVLDHLVTDLVGGIASEEHPFPPPKAETAPFRHLLERTPVARVVSLYGQRDGQPRAFREGQDWKLLADRRTVEWTEKAELPDPGTLVAVTYLPADGSAALDDLQVGSVLRTLTESIALELARVYAALDAVAQASVVDTATGSALERVVALLGVERVRGGRPSGEVRFERAPASRGAIAVLAGTRVMTVDGGVEYETVETATMLDGQNALVVGVRDVEPNDPLPAGALTVLPVPISGIGSVSNPKPTAITADDESDPQLRARAKSFLHGSERATLGALTQAIARQGIAAELREPAGRPGYVEVVTHVDRLLPEQHERLLAAIEAARPAGIVVAPPRIEPPKRVDLSLRLTTAPGLPERDLLAAQRGVKAKVEEYFRALPFGSDGSATRLVGLALSVPGVEDARILSAAVDGEDKLDPVAGTLRLAEVATVLGDLRIADPALASRLSAVIVHSEAEEEPDGAAIEAALAAAAGYWNNLPAGAPAEKRTISFGKLLFAIPLPGKPAGSLAARDGEAAPAPLPTAASTPYEATFTITAGGLARTLSLDSDAYPLAPEERVGVGGVTLEEPANVG